MCLQSSTYVSEYTVNWLLLLQGAQAALWSSHLHWWSQSWQKLRKGSRGGGGMLPDSVHSGLRSSEKGKGHAGYYEERN